MMVEQIRYYVAEDNCDLLMDARRALSRVRGQLGLPEGRILVADPMPDEGPALVWQCVYADEGEMGTAEAALFGNADYESARERLVGLAVRVEVEFYSSDEDEDEVKRD